jgi:hypothetical protein
MAAARVSKTPASLAAITTIASNASILSTFNYSSHMALALLAIVVIAARLAGVFDTRAAASEGVALGHTETKIIEFFFPKPVHQQAIEQQHES